MFTFKKDVQCPIHMEDTFYSGTRQTSARLGSRREAGSGRAGVVSLMGNKGMKKAPVLGQKAEGVSREAFTPTFSG